MIDHKIKLINQRQQIKEYLNNISDSVVCEVGTRTGDFLENTLLTNNCKLLIAIDIWTNTGNINQNDNDYDQQELDKQYIETFNKFLSNPNIKILREFSNKAHKFFPDNFFDFVYIDADHSENGCYEDLNNWYPKVKIGGILSGHDYISKELCKLYGHKTEFGVIEAVSKFKIENNILSNNFHLTSEEYATYFIVKA
jgi:hypothetical protein